MATQDDIDAILKLIVREPGDDAPRLIYADMLEENGEAEQAEFIRVQIRLAALRAQRPQGNPDDSLAMVFEAFKQEDPEIERLQQRETELFNSRRRWDGQKILAPLQERVIMSVSRVYGFDPYFSIHRGDFETARWVVAVYRRGFVDEIRCPFRMWLGSGAIVANSIPVSKWSVQEIYYAEAVPTRKKGHQLGGLYLSTMPATKEVLESNQGLYNHLVKMLAKWRRERAFVNRKQAEAHIKTYLAQMVRPS